MLFCKLVFLQIGVSLPAATQYLEWSRRLCYRVTKAVGRVAYNNPMTGFPVHIRKEKEEVTEYRFRSNGKNAKLYLKERLNVANPTKTSTSSVPAMIHSVDAGILMMSVERSDFPVALIHDSFGSHPNNMSTLKENVNISLNDIYESNVLQSIADQLIESLLDRKSEMMENNPTLSIFEEAGKAKMERLLEDNEVVSREEMEELFTINKSLNYIKMMQLDTAPYQGTFKNGSQSILNSEHGFS